MTTALEVRGLSVGFGDRTVVDKVSFAVDAGEIFGIVGESGSGKSTLALAILGLLPADANWREGELRLYDLPLAQRRSRRGDQDGLQIAYVPQEPLTALNPTLRTGVQIDLVLRRRYSTETPGERRQRAVAALSAMRIEDPERLLSAYPFELSGGEVQRALLAQAFALEPQVILADEPTTALDVTVQADVLGLINAAARESGTAVVFISHNIGVVNQLCGRVAVLRRGRIVETGPADQVLGRPKAPYTRALLAALPSRSPPRLLLPVGDDSW